MLAFNYTQEILDLQDVSVEKVENSDKKKRIHIKLGRKVVNCPSCKAETSKIHDYRTQIVKDFSFAPHWNFILFFLIFFHPNY